MSLLGNICGNCIHFWEKDGKDIGIDNKDIGKINVYATHSYVAIKKSVVKKAFNGLKNGKIKGKKLRVWWLG